LRQAMGMSLPSRRSEESKTQIPRGKAHPE
jgi:hypothetical protein